MPEFKRFIDRTGGLPEKGWGRETNRGDRTEIEFQGDVSGSKTHTIYHKDGIQRDQFGKPTFPGHGLDRL